jgi:beta-galactosidase
MKNNIMRNYFIQLKILALSFCSLSAQVTQKMPEYSKVGFYEMQNTGRNVYDFNVGWRFYKGAVESAELTKFDDSNWEVVNTPHGLELISAQASGSNNYQGEAWYRKHFTIPDSVEDKRLTINFEAVMGKCKVWLNGELLASHFGGYLPFSVDISNKIKKGEENIIAVWADNSDDPNYPPGKAQVVLDFSYFGGIYRDVWLVATNQIYITNPNQENKVAGGGLFVHYEDLSNESVKVVVETDIANNYSSEQDITIQYLFKDADGSIVSKTEIPAVISANSSKQLSSTIEVIKPNLWTPKKPYQYNLEILIRGKRNLVIDGVKQKLGIRKIEFKGKDGFYLNNKPYEGKLMGANRHQDYGYVGNALPNSGQWRDAAILKDAGCEIIRAAHYPADPAFMDACDALGMFFIVATPGWQFWNEKNSEFEKLVYQDIREMVRRDRNYASVLLWEPILNETHYPDYFAKKAHNIVHEEYPYQGVFTACDSRAKGMEFFDIVYTHPQFANKPKVNTQGAKGAQVNQMEFDYGDEKRSVFTREWGDNVDDWKAHNSPSRVGRGWGESPQLIQANHYANAKYMWTNWENICSTPAQHVGGALWHSFDHQRGYHPDPFYGGITDVFRQPKYSYYLFKSQLKPMDSEPMVYIAHEMTPFSSSDVTVFTNCDEVRLIVMAKDTITIKQNRSDFNMPSPIMLFKDVFDFMDIKSMYRNKRYAEASLVAEGIIDGKVVVTTKKTPSHRKTKIKLELANRGIPLTANGSDFITLIASIVDDNGNVKRLSQDCIKFKVKGEGSIIGDVDIMANPKQTEWGTAPVLIQSTTKVGEITVIASILDEGTHTPVSSELTFSSVSPASSLLFNESRGKGVQKTEKVEVNSNTDNISLESLKIKMNKMEKELNDYKLKEVERQQEEFGVN